MVNHYNIFLDDCRSPSYLKDIRSWEVVRNYQELVKLISEKGIPEFISFDHDLTIEHYPLFENENREIPYGEYKEKTGYHCAQWLIDYCLEHNIPFPDYQVHSMNPVGRLNIISLLENFKEWQKDTGITN